MSDARKKFWLHAAAVMALAALAVVPDIVNGAGFSTTAVPLILVVVASIKVWLYHVAASNQ